MTETLQNLIGISWLAVLISSIIKVTAILIVAPVMMMLLTWIERRAIALMQDRRGPNRAGPLGLLQPIADGVKLFTKEDVVPQGADRAIHFLAPVVAAFGTMMAFAVVPWGNLVPVDMNVGILFIIALSSVHVLGFLMAGWGSNNKFSLLGGMRGVAQLISYEIPQVMSLVAIVMLVGSMSLKQIIDSQSGWYGMQWHVFSPIGFVALAIFFVSSLAEGERSPFDIPEADSEIVAGHLTEYGGMKFAIFYLANYLTNLLICFVTTIVFLGGGYGPGVTPGGGILSDLLSVVYFLGKSLALFFIMVWIRGVVPRLRVDQLMGFAWKFLLPLALVNIFSTGVWIGIINWGLGEAIINALAGLVNGLLGLVGASGFGQVGPLGSGVTLAIAFVVTLLINLGSFVMIYRINRRTPPNDEYILVGDELADEVALSAA